MADFANLIYGTAQNAAQNVGKGIPEAVASGAELAMRKEQLDQQTQAMQLKMQELQQTKIGKLYEFIGNAHNYQNAADRNAYLKNAYGYAAAMGLNQSVLPPGALDGIGSDENMGRSVTLQNMVESQQVTPEQYFTILRDKEAFAKLIPTPASAIDLGKVAANPALKDVLDRQNALKVAAIRASSTIGADKQLDEFGKMVANPSSRSEMGQAKQMVNAADAIAQLTEAKVPPNASRADRIAAYDKLTPGQNAEVIRNLDRLLSRSNPTVHGQESLEPKTGAELVAKYGQKVLNTTIGARQGEFIINNMDTVKRERKINADKFRASAQSLKSTKVNAAAVHGPRMDQVIDDALKIPATGDMIPFGKRQVSRASLEAYVSDTSHTSNPDYAAAKAALGGP